MEKAKVGLAMELPTLYEQMEKAKVDVVAEFRASQPFIDACVVYYGIEFEDWLKKVRSIYLDLDLSKVTLDDPVSSTPGGGDIVNEKSDDSTHIEEQDSKDVGVVLAQPIPDGFVAPMVLSTKDFST